MINKNYIKLLRKKNENNSNFFIYEIISKRIIDSLDLIKVDFSNICEIGINENKTYKYLYNKFPESSFNRADIYEASLDKKTYTNIINIDLENLDFGSNKFNLIYSNSFLHLFKNFEKALENIFISLKPNGLFIAALPDIDNLYQLVNSMYEADSIIYNGVYQRFNPTINIENILAVLKKLNYNIPTLTKNDVTIYYKDFKKLLQDLRETNLSYSYIDKRKYFENKKYFSLVESIYKKKFYKEEFILNLKFNIIIAWKK